MCLQVGPLPGSLTKDTCLLVPYESMLEINKKKKAMMMMMMATTLMMLMMTVTAMDGDSDVDEDDDCDDRLAVVVNVGDESTKS